MVIAAVLALLLSLLPASIYWSNRGRFRTLPVAEPDRSTGPTMSVLIPARNEAATLEQTLPAVIAQLRQHDELLVLDDHSEDGTADVVAKLAGDTNQIRVIHSAPLPVGWNGKQHACWQLAQHSQGELLVFVDADIHWNAGALERLRGLASDSQVALWSGFPKQRTASIGEELLVPLIQWVLLSLLPLAAMRRWLYPSMGAGCGQLMIVRADAYHVSRGHAAIPDSRHDGLRLPRALRQAGYRTDVFDAHDILHTRNWQSFSECWNGLAKNATEGFAKPGLILPITLLLLGGQLMPFVVLPLAIGSSQWLAAWLTGIAAVICYLPRLDLARRYGQSWRCILLHPAGVSLLVLIQWSALLRSWLGWSIRWHGRRS